MPWVRPVHETRTSIAQLRLDWHWVCENSEAIVRGQTKTYLDAANLIHELGKLCVKLGRIWGQHDIRIPFQIHAGNGKLPGQVPNALDVWNFKRFVDFEHCNYLLDLDKERWREENEREREQFYCSCAHWSGSGNDIPTDGISWTFWSWSWKPLNFLKICVSEILKGFMPGMLVDCTVWKEDWYFWYKLMQSW